MALQRLSLWPIWSLLLHIAAASPTTDHKACSSAPAPSKICFVDTHNDLATDDSQYILTALQNCNNGGEAVFNSTLNYYVASALNLTFLSSIYLNIQGNITFSNDTTYWQTHAFNQTYQNATTFFELGGNDVHIYGGGTLNGQGQAWYDLYAKNDLILRPVLFGAIGLHNSTITNLNLLNSPQWNHFVANSTNVTFTSINIKDVSTSTNPAKNTDGWDIYRSSHIVIQNSTILNDDDCVSFKPNTTDITVQHLTCTGSHGISVGSLGQYVGETDIVQNVYVYNTTLINATDGARIKVWPGASAELSADLQGGGGTGYVKNITYDTMHVVNVDYAVELTQCYGQKNITQCFEHPSNLTISDVTIKNIYGTTSGKYQPIIGYLVCSSNTTCSDIVVEGLNVKSPNGTDAVTCGNVNQKLLQNVDCVTENLGTN